MKYINGAPNAPAAIGPYSQACVVDNIAYISGQIPLDPQTGKIVEGGVEKECEQVLKNLRAVLSHLGADFNRVVKTTIFLTDLSHFQAVNKIYATFMGDSKPARATIQVAALPMNAQVEIEAVATLA
jgi:2-iminobutanoate/2-iminopropanoate deaminase